MTFALNLSAQLWPLVDLIVAIFQPAVVLLLCGGVVVASMHLFAMLGTQWGHRRVTGKALIFSLAIHASLICGVIALVPEYHPTKVATAFEPDDAVEITSELNSETHAIDEQHLASESSRPIWKRIRSAPVPTPERPDVEIPEAAPATISPAAPRPSVAPVAIPEPVFVPLPPTPQESSELAHASVPQEYNPAAFQPTMDVIAPPEAARAASRAAPLIERSIESPASNQQLARMERRPPSKISTDFNPGLEVDLPSALPSPDAISAPVIQREQVPVREGPAPAQITDNAEEALPPRPQPVNPQLAAPNSMPARPTPRPFPGADTGLVKIERNPRTTSGKGPPRDIENDPVLPTEQSDVGLEPLPKLIRPKSMSAVPLADSTPAQYQLRSREMREQALEQFGGTAQSEAAVDAALKWLASIQDVEGFWDGDAFGAGKVDVEGGINREFAGRDADTGLTALAILAFLGKQNTLEEGDYSPQVQKALRWLVYQQGKNAQGVDGYLGGNAAEIAGMYSHAIATFAIAEAYAMTKDPEQAAFLLEPLRKAVRFTLLCQLEDGGWRYKRGQQGGGDMSIFGWHLMSLKSAQAAGLEIPIASRQKMILFLQQRGLGKSGGLAAYRPNERPTVAMTAESLFCKQMLGLPREHPSCDEAVNFLLTNPPSRKSMNLYTWYYSTLAMYQYGGEPWQKWNEPLRDLLIAEQNTTGPHMGSWEPRDQWGGYGGRIYSTAFATLTLEVYYRYLPLYRTTAPAAVPQAAEPTGERPPASQP